jgi:hypothetical protein
LPEWPNRGATLHIPSVNQEVQPVGRNLDGWVSQATNAALAKVEFPVCTEAKPGFYQTVLRE